MGSERQSLIDVELARTEFRLDVLKLREQLGTLVPALRPKGTAPSKKEAGERSPADGRAMSGAPPAHAPA